MINGSLFDITYNKVRLKTVFSHYLNRTECMKQTYLLMMLELEGGEWCITFICWTALLISTGLTIKAMQICFLSVFLIGLAHASPVFLGPLWYGSLLSYLGPSAFNSLQTQDHVACPYCFYASPLFASLDYVCMRSRIRRACPPFAASSVIRPWLVPCVAALRGTTLSGVCTARPERWPHWWRPCMYPYQMCLSLLLFSERT